MPSRVLMQCIKRNYFLVNYFNDDSQYVRCSVSQILCDVLCTAFQFQNDILNLIYITSIFYLPF